MNFKQILPAVAFIGVLAASQSALAGVIVTTYSGSANFGSGSVGYDIGSVAPNPNSITSLVSVGMGGDSFTSANHTYDFSSTGQFNAWCIDIYHWMSSGTVTYNVGSGSDLAAVLGSLRPSGPSGATRVGQLVHLANEVYSFVDTKEESAAFQLAVWEIAFGTPNQGVYQINTTDSGFRVDSNTAGSTFGKLANEWLSKLDTAPNTGPGIWTLTYLNDGTQNNTQDAIVFTDPPITVPEPASIALIGVGLVGLAYIRRKKA